MNSGADEEEWATAGKTPPVPLWEETTMAYVRYLTNDEYVNLLPYATNCARWAKLLDKHSVGLCGTDLRALTRIHNYLIRNALAVHHGKMPKRDMAVEREASGWVELCLSAEHDGQLLSVWWDDVPPAEDMPLID